MTTLVLGVSHRSAPMSVLDAVALSGRSVDLLTERVLGGEYVDGALVLTTCNRLEIVADVRAFHGGLADVGAALVSVTGIDWADLAHHVYVRFDDKAVEHLLTVASGLDSMAVGESQILGQLRQSYSAAQEDGRLTGELSRTVQESLRVGKRAHAETELDSVARSLLDTALTEAVTHIGPLAAADVLVVGAGAMSGLSVASLARQGVASLTVLNRTLDKAQRLADSVAGRARELTPDVLAEEFARADLVISVTGARGTVIDAGTVTASLDHLAPGAEPTSTFVVDLALPFDVDPDVETHEHVRTIGLEGLSSLFADSAYTEASGVVEIVAQVRSIIHEELASLSASRRARQIAPTVTALRRQARDTVDREFERLSRRLGGRVSDKDLEEIRNSLRRVATSLLHTPTVRVKELMGADDESVDYAAALSMLFDLQRTPPASVDASSVPGPDATATAAEAMAANPFALASASLGGSASAASPASAPTAVLDAAAAVSTPDSVPGSGSGSAPSTDSSGSGSGSSADHYVAADGQSPVADHTMDVIEPDEPTGRTVRLGTRRSRLARSQSTAVAQQLAAQTGWRVEIVEVVTEGDVNMRPLASFGGTGVFVSAVRSALLSGTIDIAVHSLKDLPTTPAPGIHLAAVTPRVDPSDVLIARDGMSLADLPAGSVIGTGSPRRAAQLRDARPDIEVTGVRGNVETRIRHVTEGRLDGVVLAAAGVRRLGRIDEVTDVLAGPVMLPAPGQGALGIECRDASADLNADDGSLREGLRGLHDCATALTVDCERAILSRAEAGCSAPIGALATLDGRTLEVSGVLADDEGTLLRVTQSTKLPRAADAARTSTDGDHSLLLAVAKDLGAQVAEELLDGLGIDPRKSVGANAPQTHLPTTDHAAGGDEGVDSR
ncbi:glutamyl-tRNA reductase [Brevibacterium jeotgali]|uniref:Multifunctional fusion protein n=1 Tax=Brevibacterium jeotgali TaxID=1262550 RepID=A0A2H1L184_9MICO|nr:glutamyl-tRNA reductase [Brevibacterium jeotgali]TWC02110.1 glutamyl-tRNA reductase /hydroxymethylbilane synthase [Brevibacterium jeotgali]SMY10540.1 glutamyl-tRNA reductase /hydroxymethylbilane synthase [Brevibacterium jeotgali]